MNTIHSREVHIHSLNISSAKGTIKSPVPSLSFTRLGAEGDAHAGTGNRQVSLLGLESIRKFGKEADRTFKAGEFAENITTEGIDLYLCAPLDRFVHGSLVLEVTQIGKKCHGEQCAIFREVGKCVMPREGIFARVLHEGRLETGQSLVYQPKIYRFMVITLSDRASAGDYEDRSGPAITALFTDFCKQQSWQCVQEKHLIPDDSELLKNILLMAREDKTDFIFTTGGTGIGPRDFTPDVVQAMLDKALPGVMDFIRLKYGSEKPNALLTRSLAGVMGQSLVFCLPGSEKAVREYMAELIPMFRHMKHMLHGLDQH